MAHILEFAKKGKVYPVSDVIEAQITNLIARMSDFNQTSANEAQSKVVESWRSELVTIRNAVAGIQIGTNI